MELNEYPGEVSTRSSGASGFNVNEIPLLIEHRWPGQPVVKRAAWVPVPREMAEDAPLFQQHFASWFHREARRILYPWEFPDRRVLPEFELFPRLARVARTYRRLVSWTDGRRRRMVRAWAVLRTGDDPDAEW